MNKYILCVSVSLCLLMSSCLNDEFLEVYPKGQQTVRGEKRCVSKFGRSENI